VKEFALICGLLSGLSGVLSALAFLKGSKIMPWEMQTWKASTEPEMAFRATAQRWNRIGLASLFLAFVFSAAASVAGYYA